MINFVKNWLSPPIEVEDIVYPVIFVFLVLTAGLFVLAPFGIPVWVISVWGLSLVAVAASFLCL